MTSVTRRIRAFLTSPQGKRIIADGQRQLSKPANRQKLGRLLSKLRGRRP